MAVKWFQEAADDFPDPVSGAKITRLTSAPLINSNIYCEQPYCSPDGRRVAILRWTGLAPAAETALYVADLESLKLTRVRPFTGGSNAAWGEWFYGFTDGSDLIAVSLQTFEKRYVLTDCEAPAPMVNSVSPDGRHLIYRALRPGPTIGIVRVDLETGEWQVIFENEEIVNPHLQFNPINGREIMVQHNRGSKLAPDGTVRNYDSSQSTTLFLIDCDGGNYRPLPAGPPFTASCTGHECFIGDTGKVAFTVHWDWGTGRLHESCRDGNLFMAGPGDEKPTAFPAPDFCFNHVCVSRCGRYFVCDSYHQLLPGPCPLIIGCFATGRTAVLLQDCGASCGAAQYTHPHAYLTTDNRRVIYNADPRGIPHVFAATIPDGFLEALG